MNVDKFAKRKLQLSQQNETSMPIVLDLHECGHIAQGNYNYLNENEPPHVAKYLSPL